MDFLRTLLPLLLAVWITGGGLRAQAPDPSLATGRNFAPFVISLKPSVQMSPLPGWMAEPARVQAELATVELPIPAKWRSPAVDFYAVTVVFDDRGDGGPAVEWRAPSGSTTVISTGLGNSGKSLGLNARTILLPQKLTRDGGIALVSYYGKFDGLVSVAVRPAREDLLAVLGAQFDPALVDEARHIFNLDEVDGAREASLAGDIRRGSVVEAELSSGIEQIEEELEFVVPLEGTIEGGVLHLEALGLDPEARIDVRVNSAEAGSVGFPAFRLDDPALVPDAVGRLVLAGWRGGSLFIPARLLLQGENSIIVTLKRSEFEPGHPVFLKNAAVHIRFGGAAPAHNAETQVPAEPDLTLPDPLVPDPSDPPLPEIVTGVQR